MIILLLLLLIVVVLAAVLVPVYVEWVIDSGKVEETVFLWLTLANFINLFIIH